MLSPQNLKEVSENLAASFLGEKSVYGEGHMTDWLRKLAREESFKEVSARTKIFAIYTLLKFVRLSLSKPY